MTVIRLRNPHSSQMPPLEWKTPEHETPKIKNAMIRIEANYSKLDSLLSQVEEKIQTDARLAEINQSLTDSDLQHPPHNRKKNSRRRKSVSAAKSPREPLSKTDPKSIPNRMVRKPR